MIKEKNMDQGSVSPGLFKAHLEPKKAKITSYKGGSSSTLEFPEREGNRPPRKRYGGGTRKVATGLSSSARLRFLRKMATVDFFQIKGRALFLTLTYPEDKWPHEPKGWKSNLQNFRKRLQRKYSEVKGFWRLELSGKDGSLKPHFHLLLILDQRISNKALADIRAFVSNAWYEVCGLLEDNHLLAGTQVLRVRSQKDWLRLTKYTGKREQLAGEIPETGNVWGVWRDHLLPVEHETVKINLANAFRIRRWMRRLARKKRGMGRLLQQQVFIRYENMNRLLSYLQDQEDKSGDSGVGDDVYRYSKLTAFCNRKRYKKAQSN